MDQSHFEEKYSSLFQKAFENASLGIVVSSSKKEYSLVNDAFVKMLGYSREELFHKNFEDITYEEDLPRNRQLVDSLLKREIPFYEYEKRFVKKDGTLLWANVHTSLVEVEPNKEVFFVIVRNIDREVKARQEQHRLLTLVENSVELMSILELDGKNSYLNKAGREMLGFSSMEEVFSTPISELHSPEHFTQVEKEVLPAILSKGRWSGTMYVRHLKTGEIFPVHNNTIRIDDQRTGTPLAVGAVMRDLRPELNARAALLESERRFRTMIEQAPVAIGLLRGSKLVIESANDAILLLWGKGKEIIGKPLLEALPEIVGQPFTTLLENVLQTKTPYYGYETKATLKRNNQLEDCYFNFVYAPVFEQDQTTGVMVLASEVTQQVRATKALAESEQRFRNLIEDAPMATAVYSGREMVIQLANEAMIRLWGKDQSVIGMKLRDALPELEGQQFHDLLDRVYTTGEPYHSADDPAELVVDGRLQKFYFNFTYKPLKDSEGKVYGILNMAVDVTAQKLFAEDLERKVRQRTAKLEEANRHLENVNRNLEQFAYITSHDLQEPLRKIRIFSDVLQTRYKKLVAPEVGDYLDRITMSSRRMSDLIQDVLDFSRIDSQEKRFIFVNLNNVISNLLVDYDLAIKEKNATINVDPLPELKAIPLQMNQLFYNLIGNALKFTRANVQPVIKISGGKLSSDERASIVLLDNRKTYFKISIEDNGIGFNSSSAEAIFTIFHRLNTRDAYEGTGIGLAICKKIVVNHNGHIYATSQEGVGSTFHVILPVEPSA